jgi:DNA-3-methyladenine glycosylase
VTHSWPEERIVVDRSMLAADAPTVAPLLLNLVLEVDETDGRTTAGRVVEVEAYTSDDPASHSHRGLTTRNASMFARAGTLYVYRIYGMHLCANVVTGPEGDGQAVLIRALVPVRGIDTMRARRPGRPDAQLCNGPGKLCQAMGITAGHDAVDLADAASPVRLVHDGASPPATPEQGRRIGISRAVDQPWRWWVG